MGRRRGFYEPEWLGEEQAERDASIPGRRYYVYILETDFGDYVGHTARLRSRIREHKNGDVQSTVGGRPQLAWYTKRPFRTRDDAASFEAALKALRQKRASRYKEITGLDPMPFRHPAYRGGGAGCLMPIIGTVSVIGLLTLGLAKLFV